jgi:hypothetical protein
MDAPGTVRTSRLVSRPPEHAWWSQRCAIEEDFLPERPQPPWRAVTIDDIREYFSEKSRAAVEKFFWKNSGAPYKWITRRQRNPVCLDFVPDPPMHHP